jgi:hypothetical protein
MGTEDQEKIQIENIDNIYNKIITKYFPNLERFIEVFQTPSSPN